jgi:quinol monooxygenase YgiN/heme-degrading monooxygenase HmoA
MKKLSLILSCLLAVSAVGCSSEPAAPEATETTGAEAAPAPVEAAPAPVAEAAPAPVEAAPPPAPPPPALPTTAVVIEHKVKDYDAWKPGFDAHEQARRDMGAKAHGLMRGIKDPNLVSVWVPTDDIAKFEAGVASPEMKKAMKDAGVIGKPKVTYMNTVDMSPPTGAQPKFGVFGEHKVKDYAAWKTAFDSHAQARTDAGIVGYAVMQDPKDPNHVYVWLDADDQAKLEAFIASPELKAKMKEAGVKGAPKMTVVSTVEFKLYQ